jgi:hypothetical protein
MSRQRGPKYRWRKIGPNKVAIEAPGGDGYLIIEVPEGMGIEIKKKRGWVRTECDGDKVNFVFDDLFTDTWSPDVQVRATITDKLPH